MALASYADQEYYEKVSSVITTDDLEKRLYIASRHIDTLTFNRIVARGFENLTEFQKDVIRLVVCKQADFEAENESLINSVLSSYSIMVCHGNQCRWMECDSSGWGDHES